MCETNTDGRVMVFRPTMDEFRHFGRYIQYMESMGAHRAGVAKIIPPREWLEEMNRQNYGDIDDMVIGTPIEQKITPLGTKSGGRYETRNTAKVSMTVKDFRKLTTEDKYKTPAYKSWDDLERKYWKGISYNSPIYGADVNGTLFGEEINTWNVAQLDTLLDFINENEGIRIAGVTNPYLYFGMWRATFPWHVEDMDLYSINYIHHGEPKTWYAIAPEDGKRFEHFAASLFAEQNKRCEAWLRHKTSLINPQLIRQNGIKVRKMIHKAGEFMITFPYGYHAGFNHGFNVAESTNFATKRWIKFGELARRCHCTDDMVQIDMSIFSRFKMGQDEGKTKVDFNERVPEPDFQVKVPHWRDIYGIPKPPPDQVRSRLQREMSRFCNQPHPPEMPPSQPPPASNDDELKVEFVVGEHVLFQASEDGRVEYGEIIATKPLWLYLIEVEGQKNFEKIEPEDVMNRDCCNLGPPQLQDHVEYYNYQRDEKIKGVMKGIKQKRVYCIVNQAEKQYHVGAEEASVYRHKEDLPFHCMLPPDNYLKRKASLSSDESSPTKHHCERDEHVRIPTDESDQE